MESKTVLESGVGWIQRPFWNWNGIKDSFGIRSRMDSKTVLELELNQRQFWNQEWDGFKKTVLELEWNQRQFWNQEWDGFKDHFGIGIESKTVLESGVGWIQRLFWNWNGMKYSFGIRSGMD